MATTLKKAISPDSPQCEEQYSAITFQFLQNFSKIYGIYNILLQTIFQTAPHFLTLGVAVPNTINTHKFYLEHHIWLKIQNSITIFHDYLWIFKIFVNLNFFYMLYCLHSITNCKFKKLTN